MFVLATIAVFSSTADAGRFRLFAPADGDGDGVPDRRDRCLVVPETVNGYADDDGCPDHLAVLDVLPRIGDTWIEADVELTRVTGVTTTSGTARVADALIPGEVVTIEARALCYAARGELVVEQGRNHVELELTPRYDQRIDWELTDDDGQPLEDVTLRFDSLCAPSHAITLADGRGTVRVGGGEHAVLIEAPGYAPETRFVRADAGRVTVALARHPVDLTDAVARSVEDVPDHGLEGPGET